MPQQPSAREVESFVSHFKALIAAIIILFVVPLILYAVYLEHRLDSFEKSLRYRPPDEIEEFATARIRGNLSSAAVQGQTVYVPAYSHIYHQDGGPCLLTITLSVRNTSLDYPIVVQSIRYFDTKGREVKEYLSKPITLPPLATTEILVEREDTSGGSGANFLVNWIAEDRVTEPVVEAVMIDTEGQQGISFARSGVVVGQIDAEDQSPDDNPSPLETSAPE